MKWLCFLFLLLSAGFLYSQTFDKILAVDPNLGAKRLRFLEGDYIALRHFEKGRLNGVLSILNDSTIMINEEKVLLKKIKRVKLSGNREGLNLLTAVCFRAGLGYTAIVSVNSIVNNDSPIISDVNAKISGTFLFIGLTAALLNQRSIRIKNPWQIKVIDLRGQVPESRF